MKKLVSLETRFFVLVAAILCIAVLGTTLAVSQSAKPFLISLQNDAVLEQAEKRAETLDRMLAGDRQFLEFVVSFPDLVSLIVGNVTDPSAASDYLSGREYPKSMLHVRVFDVLGDQILEFRPADRSRESFSVSQFKQTATAFINVGNEIPTATRLLSSDETTHILFAVPIFQGGLVEGVLVAELAYPSATFSTSSDLVRSSWVALGSGRSQRSDLASQTVSVPVGFSGLSVVVMPDESAALAVGQDMLEAVVVSVSLVLLVPFGLFALIGRNALIRPHAALRDSEMLLKQQKKDLSELAAIAENASDAIIVTDLDARIRWVNPTFERMCGRPASDVIGLVPGDFLQGPETDGNVTRQISDALRERKPINCELLNYTCTGAPYWASLSISPLFNENREAYGFMAISRDITEERKQHEALVAAKSEIEVQALIDPLTELPNRRALDQAIAKRMRSAQEDVTIIRIDLDRFKYVNDTLGHDAGDYALCETARIIRSETRETDIAARIGGDEFVILLGPGATIETGTKTSERLRARIREPMTFQGKVLQIGASFGVASSDGNIIDRSEVSVSADSALYMAKDRGRNRIEVYAPALHSEVVDKRNLAAEIRSGIRQREFVPFFQPQVDAQTFEITGAETLARWMSPIRGTVNPGVFLPIADQLSVVEEIDAIVFEDALDCLSRLSDEGLNFPKVSFNVTAHRLSDPSILEIVAQRAPADLKISFEILESVLLEDKISEFNIQMDLLRDSGIEIEIDDFGSGHASIIGLLRAAPDTMKIDQRLIAPLTDSKAYRQMVESIVQIGKAQDIKVVAEGVETYEHAIILRNLGVDFLQGYYFARPMPEQDLAEFLAGYDQCGGDANRTASA